MGDVSAFGAWVEGVAAPCRKMGANMQLRPTFLTVKAFWAGTLVQCGRCIRPVGPGLW